MALPRWRTARVQRPLALPPVVAFAARRRPIEVAGHEPPSGSKGHWRPVRNLRFGVRIAEHSRIRVISEPPPQPHACRNFYQGLDRMAKDTSASSVTKYFVLDTNVLLHNPNSLFAFADNHVI